MDISTDDLRFLRFYLFLQLTVDKAISEIFDDDSELMSLTENDKEFDSNDDLSCRRSQSVKNDYQIVSMLNNEPKLKNRIDENLHCVENSKR